MSDVPGRVLWTSGFDFPHTGVGLIQRKLHSGLSDHGWRVVSGPSRPSSNRRVPAKFRQALHGVPPQAAAALVTMSPAPLRLHKPAAAVIYDLRWLRTASRAKALYRRADLARTVRAADEILVISNRTAADLCDVHPEAAARVSLLPLGPGNFNELPAWDDPRRPTSVLLVGGARHKRNEDAVEALARARPRWVEEIVGVGLSPRAEALAAAAFERCTFHHALSAESMRRVFLSAGTFVLLSKEEGFGFPYIEALGAGCTVVGIDQPLTRELLQGAAVLIEDGSIDDIAQQLRYDLPVIPSETRRRVAGTFSWSKTVTAAHRAIERAIRAGDRK